MKEIPGYPGYYADSTGAIWSSSNWRGRGTFKMRPAKHRGYLQLGLMVHGKKAWFYVHRLVALAFLGRPGPGQEIRHINGVRDDNRPENLAWGTAKENASDRERHGNTLRGEKNGKAKLSNRQRDQVCADRRRGMTLCAIADKFGVWPNTIRKILISRCPEGVSP